MALSKVFIVGAGNIGASSAEVLARKKLGTVHLYDRVEGFAEGQAMDINQASPSFSSDLHVVPCRSVEEMRGSDVVLVTAGVPRHAGMSRMDLLKQNLAVVESVGTSIMAYCPQARVLLVTNPVDALAWRMKRRWPAMNVVGLGCALDVLRFRFFIAQAAGVLVESTAGTVIGLHSDSMVPLASHASAGGVLLRDLLTDAQIGEVVRRTKGAGTEIVQKLRNRSGFYAASNAIAEVVESMLFDKRRVFSLSVLCNGEYGYSDVCLSLPCVVGADPAHRIVEIRLEGEERRLLDGCAAEISDAMAGIA